MSYKALYDIQFFKKVADYVMLFKAYPTYTFFQGLLFYTTYSVQQHILLYNIDDLYNIYVQQHIYVYQQHIYVIEFHNTYIYTVSLNNIYVMLR